jgi:hypothetical protein
MTADLSIYTRGVQMLRQLRALQPGEAFRISTDMLSSIVVRAHPVDRQTPEYLVEWFKIRLPFFTLVRERGLGKAWEFYRPLPEELEHLMAQEEQNGKTK